MNNQGPLSNPDIEMKEGLNRDTEDEYLELLEDYLVSADNMEMDNDENGTSHTPVPPSLTSLLSFDHHNSNNHLLLRNKDSDSTSRPESIMPAMQQNAAASSRTADFRRNLDSPLFKVGNKRPKEREEHEEEEHKKQNEKRQNQKPVHVQVRASQFCDEFVC